MMQRIVCTGIVLLASACGGAGSAVEPMPSYEEEAAYTEPAVVAEPAPSAAPVHDYAPEVQSAFMEECVGAGGPESVCGCVLFEMQNTYSETDLANNAIDPVWLDAATIACLEPYLEAEGL